jgi:ribonuclease R
LKPSIRFFADIFHAGNPPAHLRYLCIMSKKRKKQGNALLTSPVYRETLAVFGEHPTKSLNYKQLAKYLNIEDPAQRSSLMMVLAELADAGEIHEVEPGKYVSKPMRAYMEGIIDITPSGAAYLLTDDGEDDVYIPPGLVRDALHGDRVKIYLFAQRRGRRPEGEVVSVIERARTEFVGTIRITGRFGFMIPDSNRMRVDVFIPQHALGKAADGQKAVVRLVEWPKGAKNPVGEVVDVLGWPGENETEMHAILLEYGFPLRFPGNVEEEAAKIPTEISREEIKVRRDFRDVVTFTIDPHDAKDFDDALSIRQTGENENGPVYEIGVHIADVTHYVRPGTSLDEEALSRATSIYLVDRVIPMLPEKLSNHVCSLRPDEEKLCFSAVFEMDSEANVLTQWFGKTIILSKKRFTYEEAQEIIEKKTGTLSDEVLAMDSLARKLRRERFRNGAIAFEKSEVKFHLDEKGKPLGVYLKESKDSNKLIEEFMLLANKKVAEYAGKMARKGKKSKSDDEPKQSARTFVYRIHNPPVMERLANFASFASKFGYSISTASDRDIARSLNKLLHDVSGKKEQNVLEQIAIRTMAKAVYSTENVGHYGLSFDFYTHFTSPIRRYPDIMVHRLLEHYLAGGSSADAEEYEDMCRHSTEMEIQATEAERASIKYKQVEFMQDKVGFDFEGIISGVTERGIFVEIIENKCEGMVRLRDIADDYYTFDDANYCIIGQRSGRTYRLGDTVKVNIKSADLAKKQIQMILLSEHSANESPANYHSSRKHSAGKPFHEKGGGKRKRRH